MPDRRNLVYIYDGSFEGYLTAVFDAFEKKADVRDITACDSYQTSFEDNICEIKTDKQKADRVIAGLRKKLTHEAYRKVYMAYLSEIKGWEKAALEWMRIAFKTGVGIFQMLNEKAVIAMNDFDRKVSMEYHRMMGFCRFSEMENGVYYCEITPTYNITALLMPHFSNRFNTQPFIINDKKRKTAGIYDGQDWYMVNVEQNLIPEISENEESCRRLWCTFYNTIAIKERVSHERRRRMVPQKYWQNMIEIKNEIISKGIDGSGHNDL